MSTEKALKYINKNITPEQFEVIVQKIKDLDIDCRVPVMATGTQIPVDVYFLEQKHDEEERRHREIMDAIGWKSSENRLEDHIKTEPWQYSRPKYRERDKIIWEMREKNNTWEDIANSADCGITTAKENYQKMLNRIRTD